MQIVHIQESQIRTITEFLISKKVIFHPVISPSGVPDFTQYIGRKYVLLLDRNILTKLIELCTKGSLKDRHLMKVISSLMFWILFNNIEASSGLALNEYASNKNSNMEASMENNIFKKLFNYYDPNVWLDIALEHIQFIPKIDLSQNKSYNFDVVNEHYNMHYAEMLHSMYLYHQSDLSVEEKILHFLEWNNENLLFCQYTVAYIVLLFGNKIKQPKKIIFSCFNALIKKCQNQAWDLTYLSVWSTLYWEEYLGDTSYLFSTLDNALKALFTTVHTIGNVFTHCLGKEKGSLIQKKYETIMKNRIRPNTDREAINRLLINEMKVLQSAVSGPQE
jgi:hypothetical protein